MNKTEHSSEQLIFKWISENQKVNEEIYGAKYQGLIAHFEQFELANLDPQSRLNILVVGGGDCKVERQIITNLGLSKVNFIACDIIEPEVTTDDVIEQVQWLPEFFSATTQLPCQIDMVICLGCSRYFQSATAQYGHMLKFLNPSALMIIDFYNLPPIKQAVIKVMGEWLKQSWLESTDKTITSLIELAKVSRSLSLQLKGCKTTFTHDAASIGMVAGELGVQQFIYESIFPFWYREGFSDSQVAAQLAWSFMCTSCDNSLEKIEQFSSLNGLRIEDVFTIYTDTNVLIASYEA